MSCHEDAAFWLVRRGITWPLIGWQGVTLGCRVTRVMLIITVGSQSEFVIVTLTRGRHGKWEGNSSDIPPTLTDYFCMCELCDSIFHWNLHFAMYPESDCKFTPGQVNILHFVRITITSRRLVMRTHSSVVWPLHPYSGDDIRIWRVDMSQSTSRNVTQWPMRSLYIWR